MKKNRTKIIVILLFITIAFVGNYFIYAKLGDPFDKNVYDKVTDESNTKLDNTVYRVTSTIITTLQIVALMGVVITGVKYMYAGSDDKAKIKQTLIWLVIGTIFVFAAPAVISFIKDSGSTVIN